MEQTGNQAWSTKKIAVSGPLGQVVRAGSLDVIAEARDSTRTHQLRNQEENGAGKIAFF